MCMLILTSNSLYLLIIKYIQFVQFLAAEQFLDASAASHPSQTSTIPYHTIPYHTIPYHIRPPLLSARQNTKHTPLTPHTILLVQCIGETIIARPNSIF